MKQWHWEFTQPGNPEIQRVSIEAVKREQSRQILIGRYAANWLRELITK
jgi:hypothetical protein